MPDQMLRDYFEKKVAKPFRWVVVGRFGVPRTYDIDVVGLDGANLHVSVTGVRFGTTGRKIAAVQFSDVVFPLGLVDTREQALNVACVMADRHFRECRKDIVSMPVVEAMRISGIVVETPRDVAALVIRGDVFLSDEIPFEDTTSKPLAGIPVIIADPARRKGRSPGRPSSIR